MIKLLYVAAAYLVILSGVALGDAMHLSEASVRRTTRVIERPLPSKSADLGTVYETYEPILMPNCIEQGAVLLRCYPRAFLVPEYAFSVVVRQRSFLVPSQAPYPQLFRWQ